MHQSGITVSESLKAAIRSAEEDPDVYSIKIEIKDDSFVEAGRLNAKGGDEENFQQVQDSLENKVPCYVLTKAIKGKWMVVFYVPDNSPVRMKMIYASSTGALKSDVGLSKFVDDFSVSSADECTYAEYVKSTSVQREVVMSPDEKMNKETSYEAAHMVSDHKSRAIVGIPIEIEDGVIAALKDLTAGNLTCVELKLTEKEVLVSISPDNRTLADLDFPKSEPRYFVLNHKHTRDGEEKARLLFIYYCPGKAVPKLKMFYSTVKANMVKLFANMEIEGYLNFECDSAEECTEPLIMEQLYPVVEEKKTFKKPSAKGRGRAKMAKFQG